MDIFFSFMRALAFYVVQCSPPVCEKNCRINYDARPCPACECDITGKYNFMH